MTAKRLAVSALALAALLELVACGGAQEMDQSSLSPGRPSLEELEQRSPELDCSWEELQSFEASVERFKSFESGDPLLIRRALAFKDAIVIQHDAGALHAIQLETGEVLHLPLAQQVLDLLWLEDDVVVLSRSTEDAYSRLNLLRWTGEEWRSVQTLGEAGCRDTARLVVHREDILVLIPQRRIYRSGEQGVQVLKDRVVPALLYGQFVCTDAGLCIGGENHGERGGTLRFMDLRSGAAGVPGWPNAVDRTLGNQINHVMQDPTRPDCLLVATGHEDRVGRYGGLYRACRKSLTKLFDGPVRSIAESGSGLLLSTGRELWTRQGGEFREIPAPTFRSIGGFEIGLEIPGVILLGSSTPAPHADRVLVRKAKVSGFF